MRLIYNLARLLCLVVLASGCSAGNQTATCNPALDPNGCIAAPQCSGVMQDCKNGGLDGCETDTSSDVLNCGGCGLACVAGPGLKAVCNSGVCGASSCLTGFAECNLDASDGCETDTQRNPSHCGACGTVCPGATNAAPGCTAGQCKIVCQAGYLDCDGNPQNGCEVNGAADIANCGSCGTTCPASTNGNPACAAGTCIISSCTAPYLTCRPGPVDGCETNTAVDLNNCGACGRTCAAVANGTPRCASSNCGIGSCNAGFNNCDGMLANGCEVNLNTDVNNCGTCNNACVVANATPSCSAATCAISSCNAGFGNCDGNVGNGCESNFNTDRNHCGNCATACTDPANATAGCTAGVCGIGSCNANYGNCDGSSANGCETNTSSDRKNCGTCGNACAAGLGCAMGTCQSLCTGVTCTPSDSCHTSTCDPETGLCSNVSKADGASCCGPIPAAHCDAVYHGTCSAGTCGGINSCGSGSVELSLGESCDDGNATAGDGCDASCHVEPFMSTAPVKISGALSCTTAVSGLARKISIDGSGNIYAVIQCGGSALVAISTDRGSSFSAPLDLSTALTTPAPTIIHAAVATGPTGVAYVAMMTNMGDIYLRTTQDQGATWSTGVLIGRAGSSNGLSLQAFNDDIYVGFARSTAAVGVARNYNRGVGAFAITDVAINVSFFDLAYDIKLGTLAVCTDSPAFHVRVSSDAGMSFAAEVNPPGSEFYSDWTIGNGQIFVSGANLNAAMGNSTSLYIIPTSAPSTSSSVSGLPLVLTQQTRTLAANDAGDAFVASQLGGAGIQLDRLAAGATTFDTPRGLDPAGRSPSVAALPGNRGAAVVYTVGTEVWATVQAY